MDINKTQLKIFIFLATFLMTLALFHLLGMLYDITISGEFFVPVDDNATKIMKQTDLKIQKDANLWKNWVSFNITHSLGAMLFSCLLIIISYIWYLLSKISNKNNTIGQSSVTYVETIIDANQIEKYKKWCLIVMIILNFIAGVITLIGFLCWFWMPNSVMVFLTVGIFCTLLYAKYTTV